jgi:hypothetical protein
MVYNDSSLTIPYGPYSEFSYNGTLYITANFDGQITSTAVCSSPTPTPTITPTKTATPTPTVTPSISTSPCINCFSGTTINVTSTGWIRWTNCAGTTIDTNIGSTGTYTINSCIVFGSIRSATPQTPLATWNSENWSETPCGDSCTGEDVVTVSVNMYDTGCTLETLNVTKNGVDQVGTMTNNSSDSFTAVAGDVIEITLDGGNCLDAGYEVYDSLGLIASDFTTVGVTLVYSFTVGGNTTFGNITINAVSGDTVPPA